LTLTFEATDATDALRGRGTGADRSEFAVRKEVELSVVADKLDTGRDALDVGRKVEPPIGEEIFRSVEAWERTDTKEAADDFGLSTLDRFAFEEMVLRRGACVAASDLEPDGLVIVTLVPGSGNVDVDSEPKKSSSVTVECVDEFAEDGMLRVRLESGGVPSRG
jgi:hypothetical protein